MSSSTSIDLAAIRERLHDLASEKIAETSRWFFKTGPGQYGEGDQFIGIRVPVLRKVARGFRELPHDDTRALLQSPIHEERLLSLLIFTLRYERGDAAVRKTVFDTVVKHRKHIDNWDLVDQIGPRVVGVHLHTRSRRRLHQWARAKRLWDRRLAIVSTLAFIREDDFEDTLTLARELLTDDHDLIHKATGWMLRELGKRDEPTLETFLDEHAPHMPRTMLRYAIERLPETPRKAYLAVQVSDWGGFDDCAE